MSSDHKYKFAINCNTVCNLEPSTKPETWADPKHLRSCKTEKNLKQNFVIFVKMSDFKLVNFGYIKSFTEELFGTFAPATLLIGGSFIKSDNMFSL